MRYHSEAYSNIVAVPGGKQAFCHTFRSNLSVQSTMACRGGKLVWQTCLSAHWKKILQQVFQTVGLSDLKLSELGLPLMWPKWHHKRPSDTECSLARRTITWSH